MLPPPLRLLTLLLLLSAGGLYGQSDTLGLPLDRLGWEDVRRTLDEKRYDVVISGNRRERKIANLPFSIYVITAEDILENGYLTLADALKSVPGIRVSQPGSGPQGELFLMRGLVGNTYAKILINDVPVRPFVTLGFPIGAQLPISQAERIEVLYGPAATLYGADASAGVINIILRKSDLPQYVQADFDSGNNGLINLNVGVGGRLGKGKRTLSYQVMGSHTSRSDLNIKYDRDSLYNPSLYGNRAGIEPDDPAIPFYTDFDNYEGTLTETPLGPYGHRSGMLGISLAYGPVSFNAFHMNRQDHAALGLNPISVSHARPYNTFGERITIVGAQYSRQYDKFSFRLAPRYQRYRTMEDNNTAYVQPDLLNLTTSLLELVASEEEIPALRRRLESNYFTGNRFNSAKSDEVALDGFGNYQFSDEFTLAGGFNVSYGDGLPIQNFRKTARDEAFNPENAPILVNSAFYIERSGFLEASLNVKRFSAVIGGQLLKRNTGLLTKATAIFNPRIGLQYNILPQLSARLYYAEAFRFPSPFYDSNTLEIDLNDFETIRTGAPGLSSEKTRSVEFGLRFQAESGWNLDAALFYSRTNDFLNYLISIDELFENATFVVGYRNNEKTSARNKGVELSLRKQDLVPALGLDLMLNLNYNRGKERVTTLDEFNDLLTLDGIRSLPPLIGQARIGLRPVDRLKITFDNTFASRSLTRNIYAFLDDLFITPLPKYISGYYTLDVNALYDLNEKSALFARVGNVFNAEYGGIDVVEDLNSLFYNPQPLRTVRLGYRYRLN